MARPKGAADDSWRPRPRVRQRSRRRVALERESIPRHHLPGERWADYAERRSCADKLYFGAEHLAQRYAELADVKYSGLGQRYEAKEPKRLRPYPCRFCEGWHLSSERAGDAGSEGDTSDDQTA